MAKPFVAAKPHPAFYTWQENKTPQNMQHVVHAYMPDIRRNLTIYQGALAPELLESEAKKLAVGAIRSFSPREGASLKTHIVNHLQRLNRITATRSRAFRMPEELQRQVKGYQESYQELVEKSGSEPTARQISEHMKVPISKVHRLRRQFVQEIGEGQAVYEGSSNAPMDDKLLYVYHDLDPRDQTIFEHLTGFSGKPIKKKSEIASMLKVSPSIITQRSSYIFNKIKDVMGMSEAKNG